MLATVLIVLTVLAAVTPVLVARKPSSQKMLETAFNNYVRKSHIDFDSLSYEQQNIVVIQFLEDNPEYADLFNDVYEETGQYDTEIEDVTATYENLQDVEVISTYNTFESEIDGEVYSVKVETVQLSDGTVLNKAIYMDPDGNLVDPYIYVKWSYLYVWFFWTKYRTGEFVEVHYKFMKNVNGINEAARYRAKVAELLNYASLGIYTLITVLAPFTYGLTGIIGAVWSFIVIDINHELTYAYLNTRNYLEVVFRVSYNYAWIGSWYDFHTVWGDGSWHMAGFPALDAVGAQILLNALKGLGKTYGYRKWVWVGIYYG